MAPQPNKPPRRFGPALSRAARGLLDWTAERLAAEAELEVDAIKLFEAGANELGEPELLRLHMALRGAGVTPIRADLAGEGVRFVRPSAKAATCDARTPFADTGDRPPHWLPLGGEERRGRRWRA